MNWEKVDVKAKRPKRQLECYITLLRGNCGTFWLSTALCAKPVTYSLLRSGNVFALKEDENGQIKVWPNRSGGSLASSKEAVRVIREAYGLPSETSCRLTARKDGGMIIFEEMNFNEVN